MVPSENPPRNQAIRRRRLTRRLIRHHGPLALIAALFYLAAMAILPADDPIFVASMATAYASLALIVATLLIGPLQLLRRRPNPVSGDLRRDIGIWAGLLGVAHMVIGLQVHLRGRPWEYFLSSLDQPWWTALRTDPFGLANHSGLIGGLLLVILLALSNDLTLRGLGSRWWKALQRLNYALLVLVGGHGLLYQQIEKREASYVGLLIGLLAVVLIAQLAGVGVRLRGARRSQ